MTLEQHVIIEELQGKLDALRRLCRDTVASSSLVDTPTGPRVLINYEHFKALSESGEDERPG